MVIKLFKELAIITTIYIFAKLLAFIVGLEHFAGIFGMLILLALLHFHILQIDSIRTISSFLLKNMAFFFIPAGVSIMLNYTLLSSNYLSILSLLALTSLTVIITTGLTVQYFVKKELRKKSLHDTHQ